MRGSFLLTNSIQPSLLWYTDGNETAYRGTRPRVQGPQVKYKYTEWQKIPSLVSTWYNLRVRSKCEFEYMQSGIECSTTVSCMIRWTTEYTDWQRPLSGIHSIMMEKSARAGGGGGCMPTPFHYVYYNVKSCGARSSWEGRYTPPISSLPLYVLYSLNLCLGSRVCIYIQYKGTHYPTTQRNVIIQ
jgi:hypothetical protein